jgi:hypothetical protein
MQSLLKEQENIKKTKILNLKKLNFSYEKQKKLYFAPASRNKSHTIEWENKKKSRHIELTAVQRS